MKCPLCNGYFKLTDLDLPEVDRTHANMWKAKFFEMRNEVVKAHKGIRRLRKRLENKRGKP